MPHEDFLERKITIFGSKKDIEEAKEALLKIEKLAELSEPEARLVIQDLIREHSLAADILYDGNTVYNMEKILQNLRRIINHGTLYDGEHPAWIPIGSMLRMPTVGKTILSEYFYEFLINTCGSIAHYSIHGWVTEYPTVDDLKKFFKKNEYGKPVRESISHWHTDAIRIVQEIEKMLFPFQHYMMQRQAECIDSK